jgi:hypothetical protein
MKLFDFFYEEDFGHDVYFTVGQFRNFNILDGQIHTSEYWSWEPDIRLTLGVFSGTVFSVEFRIWAFSIGFNFISYRSPFHIK